MPQIATRVSRGTLDADVVIESGQTIRVHSVIVTNGSAGSVAVDFKIGDGTGDPILTLCANTLGCIVFDGKWLADKGLSADSLGDADVVVNVIHSAPGV